MWLPQPAQRLGALTWLPSLAPPKTSLPASLLCRHFAWDATLGGIRYVQHPRGYPEEQGKERLTGTTTGGDGWQPLLLFDATTGKLGPQQSCYWCAGLVRCVLAAHCSAECCTNPGQGRALAQPSSCCCCCLFPPLLPPLCSQERVLQHHAAQPRRRRALALDLLQLQGQGRPLERLQQTR